MAVDSAAKRKSVLGVIVPDSSISQFDRQTMLEVYGGIAAAELVSKSETITVTAIVYKTQSATVDVYKTQTATVKLEVE